MSSAAPSVSGAPSAAPVPAVSGEPTATPAPAAEPKRQIRPIPPKSAGPQATEAKGGESEVLPGVRETRTREVLPGVVTGGDVELPVRGPDGRFVSRAEAEAAYDKELAGEDAEGEEPEQEAAPEPEPEQEPRKPELPTKDVKIRFLNKDVTVAEAEQMFRSLQGMHDPLAKKLAQAEKDRDDGYRAGNAWEQIARDAQAELAQLKSGRPEGKGTPKSGQPVAEGEMNLDGLVDAIDYDAFELIAHDPQGGTRVAGRYLASQILNTVMSQMLPALRAEMMQQVQPMLQTTQEAAVANEVAGVINSVAQYNTLDGQPAFPELQDEATLAEIGAVWHDSMPTGVDPKAWAKAAMTPQGLINAIALYRLLKGLPAGVTEATTPSAAPAEVESGAAALVDGGAEQHIGMGRPGRAAANEPPEAKFFRRAFDNEPLFDKTLGFAKNRRT